MREEKDLADRISTSNLYNDTFNLVNIKPSRAAGTSGESTARDYLLKRFVEVGLKNVHFEPFRYSLWKPLRYIVKFVSPDVGEINGRPMIGSGNTPNDGITAEVIYVGDGTKEDYARFSPSELRGKIHLCSNVVVRNTERIAKYWNAYDNGARAFLIFHDVDLHEEGKTPLREGGYASHPIGLPFFHATPLPKAGKLPLWSLPGVAISNRDGLKILEMLKKGSVIMNIVLKAKTEEATSWNVIGEIPGETKDFVTFTSHYDNVTYDDTMHFQGASDNATACACCIEIARIFSGVKKPHRSIRFISFGVEEQGLYGSFNYVIDHLKEIREHCKLAINIDIIGLKEIHGRQSLFSMNLYPKELTPLIKDICKIYDFEHKSYAQIYFPERNDYTSDHFPFTFLGNVPSTWMRSIPDMYYHSEYDTIDTIDFEEMKHQLAIHTILLHKITEPSSASISIPSPQTPEMFSVPKFLGHLYALPFYERAMRIVSEITPAVQPIVTSMRDRLLIFDVLKILEKYFPPKLIGVPE